MSILIKNMTLPKNCAECRLCDTCECLRDFRTYEEVLDAVEDGDLTRDQNCPLVEIPGTHGRLIDVDKIDYRNDAMHDGTGHLVVADNFMNGVLWINDCIDNAPTIIEAEGEG